VSSFAEDPTLVWFVHFYIGFLNADVKLDTPQVWCVRGGMNAEAY
jgi:hypothetical protein